MRLRAVATILVGALLLWSAFRWREAFVEPPSGPTGAPADAVASESSSLGSTPADVLAREAMSTVAAAPLPATRVVVEVVLEDGTPAAGAEVRWWPPLPPALRSAAFCDAEHGGDLELVLREKGQTAVADERGRVEVAADPDTKVIARFGELYGELELGVVDDSLAVWRIELARDVTLRVAMVDTANVPVVGGFVDVVARLASRRHGHVREELTLGPTGPDGVVVLPHAQLSLSLSGHVVHGEVAALVERRLADTGGVIDGSASVPATGLQGVVELTVVVPSGGTIDVILLDADGRPADAWVMLFDQDFETFDIDPEDWAGRSRFRRVPLGRRWTIRARCGGLDHDLEIEGPEDAAQPLVVEMVLPFRRWDLAARVVRDDGATIGVGKAWLRGPDLEDGGFECSLRPDGRIPLGWFWLRDTVNALSILTLEVESPLVPGRVARVAHGVAPGTFDFGDIVVAPRTDERELARVSLTADGRAFDGSAHVRLCTRDGGTLAEVPAIAQREGDDFVFRGPVPDRPLVVTCAAEGWLYHVVEPWPIGARRVVDLRRSSSVDVAIESPSVPPGAIEGELVPHGGEPIEWVTLDEQAETLSWSQIEPGRYSLRVRLCGKVIHEVPEIELLPGGNRWPQDGARIDLRASAQARCLVALDAATGARVGIEALHVAPGTTELPPEDERHYEEDGWFLLREPRADLLVRAWGYVPVRVRAPTDDVLLRLQPATRLVLEIEGEHEAVVAAIVDDAVQDPLLRAFDDCIRHEPELVTDDHVLWFAPNTILQLRVVRAGVRGPAHRVVVGSTSPQTVNLR